MKQDGFRVWRNWLFISLITRWAEILFVFLVPSAPLKFLGGVCVGLMMGGLQWLVIKRGVGGWSKLWVIITWVGYVLATMGAYTAFRAIEPRFLGLRPGFTEYDVGVVFFYMYWMIEALVIGTLQSLLMRRWTRFAWRWVTVLVISVSIEFLILYSTSAMASLLMGPSILGFIIVLLAMILTFSITGAVLVNLLESFNPKKV